MKNNGKWWTEGIISDAEFLDNIEYLVANGIITIGVPSASNDEIEMKTESVLFEALENSLMVIFFIELRELHQLNITQKQEAY